jgi:hypothetical protein
MDRARLLAAAVSIVMIGATLSPLARDPYDDGFPLSTYPMFASKRPTVLTFHYALGEGSAGERVTLTPGLVGTGEVLQAMRVIDRAVGGGRAEMTKLCDAIARRIVDDDDFAHVTSVRIVTGTHDALDYLVRDTLGRETERLRCAVPRGGTR